MSPKILSRTVGERQTRETVDPVLPGKCWSTACVKTQPVDQHLPVTTSTFSFVYLGFSGSHSWVEVVKNTVLRKYPVATSETY